jgi:hypothetical protein
MYGSTVTSSVNVGFILSTPRFIQPMKFQNFSKDNNLSSTRLHSSIVDAPITLNKRNLDENKVVGCNDLLV